MSDYDYNLNNSFDNFQISHNEQNKEKNRNVNTMTIPKRYKSPVIYDLGVDNYVINEIKKAKYQGAFDPGSVGNKNIFLDGSRSNNKNSGYNNQQKSKKNKIHYNRLGDGKNLLIIKSETQYPINYDNNTMKYDNSYMQGQGKNIYNFNNYYIESRNNNYRNIYARSNDNKRNYFSPKNKEKNSNYLLKNNNYQINTINIDKLNKDYNRRFNEPKMTLYEKYSTNTISFNNPIKNYSPTFAPSRNQNYINQKAMKNINMSYSKKINDINKDNELLHNTYNFDNDKNLDDYIQNDFDIKKNENNQNNKDIKLIHFYRKKLLNLFFWHIKNFYKMHFKSIFKEIINIIKMSINNKEHNFENKTIKNIAMLKKQIKNNSFFYGNKGQYDNILKDINIKKNIRNLELDKQINNNTFNTENKTYLETDINNNDEEKEINSNQNNSDKKSMTNQKDISTKTFLGNKNNINNSNKKYVKKIIPKKIYGKKIVRQQFKKLRSPDINNEKKFENKIYPERKRIIEKTPIIQKNLKFPKTAINDNKIFNSGIKIIDKHLNNNENSQNSEIKLTEENSEKKDKDKKDTGEEIIKKEQENIEVNNIEKNTIKNQIEEKDNIDNIDNINELDNNENEIENYSNKNLENALTMITKVIENKEKSDKENKILSLNKIINKKINKDNHTLIQKYFDILKQDINKISEEDNDVRPKLELPFDSFKKKKLNKNKKLNRNSSFSDFDDNEEKNESNIAKNSFISEDGDKTRNKKNKDKIRIVMKQIRLKSYKVDKMQYNQNDNFRTRTPIKENKNSEIDTNNKTPKIIIKKTINIIFNKPKENIIKSDNENKKEINEQENILDTKEIDYNKDILDNNENKSNSNLEMNLELDKENVIIEEQDKKNQNNEEKEFSIESFTKHRKSKDNINQNEDEEDLNNKEDIALTEKYQDCENLVYFLRSQLIYYFLVNKNSNDSFLD